MTLSSTTIKGAPIRIRDIGYAEDGTKEARSSSRVNGKPTVTLEIRRQSGANTIEVIEGVKASLKKISAQLPPDVKLQMLEDQSGFIYSALHEINIHLIVGSILASLVVFAFMRNWRAMIIAAVAIPVFADCSVWRDVGASLHAEQRHDAVSGADGWHRYRRRSGRARKHVPVHGRKEDGSRSMPPARRPPISDTPFSPRH